MLVVVSGLPGTGKSTIANALGTALGLPVLSVDPIESAILGSGLPQSFETGYAAYLVAQTVADENLRLGLGSVVDAVSSVEAGRDMWREIAARHSIPLRVIVCVVPDEATHRERLAARDRRLASGEPSWAQVQEQRSEWQPWPERHLTLNSTRPSDENVAAALDFVAAPAS